MISSQRKGLSLESLKFLQHGGFVDTILAEPAEFANIILSLRDSEHEYRLVVREGAIQRVDMDVPAISHPVDVTISAQSEAWDGFFQENPPPPYADIIAMFTENHAQITGNTLLFFQHITFITYMFRQLGHRKPLVVANGASKPEGPKPNGHVEDVVGKYVHLSLDGHDYRVFFEESGPKDGIPVVLLHAANSDARMWRHQLGDSDLASRFHLFAFDMPWRGRSVPPQELLRTEYKLTNSFYRRIIRAFCDALQLDRPILVGCSMGGYIMFYIGKEEPERYRALIAVAVRDFEPRRWLMERVFRHPAVSFNRVLSCASNGFMAPTDPPGCSDEVAWLYETGSPRALRGDLNFASRDCDARPFMAQIDTSKTPFYVLGGEYDWSCTKEHTDLIKQRMPQANVVRMKGIGHFPPDENPGVFKEYIMPVLDEVLKSAS
ncbi:uncharacterized protein Z518_04587 [Rhinocladiella mackenziei CBS 650.93]|uniref:Rhinocladiella mackenziei CBS 650.93 unplaced genomic scaffold supercont1.3, whole genome shotgun sequence n=1 Tax=Rhinocladiella mackenziei CBS 650.93 TaxID=1442369 RepID=A0A0D2ITW7_9EURO|nr:uncharacterized protein Z518_04587 [Rhinocladiella mackenziei CBS 650.93]KIX06611.1 hypothetical protein Z518_04587 [Rhinocladiella mackenziei CBS 650.93]